MLRLLLQVDSLIEAFGTNKQKRALSSRRLNQVGSDTLQQAVAKAAITVIDQKGLEGRPRVDIHCVYVHLIFSYLLLFQNMHVQQPVDIQVFHYTLKQKKVTQEIAS